MQQSFPWVKGWNGAIGWGHMVSSGARARSSLLRAFSLTFVTRLSWQTIILRMKTSARKEIVLHQLAVHSCSAHEQPLPCYSYSLPVLAPLDLLSARRPSPLEGNLELHRLRRRLCSWAMARSAVRRACGRLLFRQRDACQRCTACGLPSVFYRRPVHRCECMERSFASVFPS